VSATPLHGPAFGSYAADEVSWLLTDLSHVDLEAPTEQREAAVQSGRAHYAESLPVEYRPGPAYTALFERALVEHGPGVAHAVATLAHLLVELRGPDLVLASLARAGTPVGVLLRRYAARLGLDWPHRTLSIVRGRGIDEVALAHLAAHDGAERVVFVDGWTGKGAITRELTAAIAAHPGFDPRVAVLADPGGCTELFGTRDDFLIPSACLNSTVSGLVSRTVLNDDLIGPGDFHGAKFYAELADQDVSGRYLDAISASFPDVADGARLRAQDLLASDRTPTWSGWRSVEAVAAAHGLTDLNLVKPGVGETTRVLLRRVPWRVLVRPERRDHLGHVLELAAERGVEVVEVADLAYSCVGIIRPGVGQGEG
jgi:hypothetical protein